MSAKPTFEKEAEELSNKVDSAWDQGETIYVIEEALQSAYAKGREEGIEEAAKVAEAEIHWAEGKAETAQPAKAYVDGLYRAATMIYNAIRALKLPIESSEEK